MPLQDWDAPLKPWLKNLTKKGRDLDFEEHEVHLLTSQAFRKYVLPDAPS